METTEKEMEKKNDLTFILDSFDLQLQNCLKIKWSFDNM